MADMGALEFVRIDEIKQILLWGKQSKQKWKTEMGFTRAKKLKKKDHISILQDLYDRQLYVLFMTHVIRFMETGPMNSIVTNLLLEHLTDNWEAEKVKALCAEVIQGFRITEEHKPSGE